MNLFSNLSTVSITKSKNSSHFIVFCCRVTFCRRFIFSRRFTLSPSYFIFAASVFLSLFYFVVAAIFLLPLKQQRKYKVAKKKKRRQKNVQRLGMALLGFRTSKTLTPWLLCYILLRNLIASFRRLILKDCKSFWGNTHIHISQSQHRSVF